ncbi:MAG: glycosyltransferase family A protein [Rhodoferax sp.]|uniref:glycosyltransferase family 2 protein n=1 Tax=Rhodoferax sp. TaxID=50421 RepID=UPI002620D631|nr:glycosyltransferase family A protein [Rhodoferax sp.]MDD2881494.1 glycosyltransferase family A protein [Rhodoferax sp.]
MLISIIVPTRNRVPLLARALQAIKSQGHESYEVLVVDDGSDTATRSVYPALMESLGSAFSLMLVGTDGQRGQGPSASRNLGIRSARGEVIAFCDDDDLWLDPCHLSAVATLFKDHTAVELCIGNQRAVHVDGAVRDLWLPTLGTRAVGRPMLTDRFGSITVADLIQSGGFGHLNMICVRRSVVQAVGGFWEAVNYEEDRDFFWRCVDASTALSYTPATVAQHHVPDPTRRVNVSSALQQQERWLVAAMVSQHIAASVKSPAIAQLCLAHEGDLLRRLALHCADHGQARASLGFACQALGARFSFKWAAYCALAWLKSLRPS